jgi:hypothetical protein
MWLTAWLCPPPAGGYDLVLTGLAAGGTPTQLLLNGLRGAGLTGSNLTLLKQDSSHSSSCSSGSTAGADPVNLKPAAVACQQQVTYTWPADMTCDAAAAWGMPTQRAALSRGALAGVCVAAVVVAGLLVAAAVIAARRMHQRRRKPQQQDPAIGKDTLPPSCHVTRESESSGMPSEARSSGRGSGMDVAPHKDVETAVQGDSLGSKCAAAGGSGAPSEPSQQLSGSGGIPAGAPAGASSAGSSSAAGSSSRSTTGPEAMGAARLHTAVSDLTRVMQQRRLQNQLGRQRVGAAEAGSLDPGSTGGSGRVVQAHTGVATGGRSQVGSDDVALQGVLGRGSFATVYSGIWRGRLVAVKLLHLPNLEALQQLSGTGSGTNQTPGNTPGGDGRHPSRGSSGPTRLGRMAVMEAAISSAMRHPNIVQVFSYSLHAVGQPTGDSTSSNLSSQPSGPGGPLHVSDSSSQGLPGLGWELRMVMEFCDRVSSRAATGEASGSRARDLAEVKEGLCCVCGGGEQQPCGHSALDVYLGCSGDAGGLSRGGA